MTDTDLKPDQCLQRALDVLGSHAARIALAPLHPLRAETIVLPVPSIEEFLQEVIQFVEVGGVGGFGEADPGSGKTSTLYYCVEHLPRLMPYVMAVYFPIDDKQVDSIRGFFINALDNVGHADLRGETPHLRLRIRNKIIDDARLLRCTVVVFFIDEAQLLSHRDLQFLRTLHNKLHKSGLPLICILLGEAPGLGRKVRKLQTRKRSGLLGRFAAHEFALRGYRSLNDIQRVFLELDKAHFAADLPIELSRFYAPCAWLRGWRLEHEAPAAWSALEAYSDRHRSIDVPPRFFFMGVRYRLNLLLHDDPPEVVGGEDVWREAFEYANLEMALNVNAEGRGASPPHINGQIRL